jgi:hypothetical protein
MRIDCALPKKYALRQNYPNPFSPSTVINFKPPSESHVTLRICNPLGQEAWVLTNKRMSADYHSFNFNTSHLISGIYIYRLEAGGIIFIEKMNYLKYKSTLY